MAILSKNYNPIKKKPVKGIHWSQTELIYSNLEGNTNIRILAGITIKVTPKFIIFYNFMFRKKVLGRGDGCGGNIPLISHKLSHFFPFFYTTLLPLFIAQRITP
jgi:hypothetical protein